MAVTDEDLAKLIVQFSADFTRYRNETQKIIRATYGAADQVERRFNSMERRVARTGGQIGRQFRTAIAALGTGFAVRDLGRLADAWTEQENALRSVAAAVDRPVSSMQQLASVATDTRSSLAATVTLYARTERAADNLGRSQDQLRRFVELTNKAFVAGGATGSERRSSILQLAQGLASGQLMGEELRSIRENAPLVARAIADAMGVGIGALRDLGSEGRITSEIVLDAVLSAGDSIEAQFEATTITVGQALENLRTRMAAYVAGLDDATNASRNLAGFIDYVSRNLDAFGEAAIVAATAVGGVLAGRAVAAAIPAMITFAAATSGASAALTGQFAAAILASRAMATLRASLMFLVTNPIGLAITAIATAVGYLAIESQNAASRADRLNRVYERMGREVDDLGESTERAVRAQRELAEERRQTALRETTEVLREQRRELERLERSLDRARRGVGIGELDLPMTTGTMSGPIYGDVELSAEEAEQAVSRLTEEVEAQRIVVSDVEAEVRRYSNTTIRAAVAARQGFSLTRVATQANEDLDDVLKTIVDTMGEQSDAQELLNELQRASAIDQATVALHKQETALREVEAAINAVAAAQLAAQAISIVDGLQENGRTDPFAGAGAPEVPADLREAEAYYRRRVELIQEFIDTLNAGANVGAASEARREREQRIRREADALRDLITEQQEFSRALASAEAAFEKGDLDEYESLLNDIISAQDEASDSIAALEAQREQGLITEARYREEIDRLNASMAQLREQSGALAAVADRNEAAKGIREQADAQERLNELVQTQLDHELQIARLRGDETQIRGLERELRIRERIAELTELGVNKGEAQQRATQEADEFDAARRYGEMRDLFARSFSDGVRAALSGDMRNFLSNTFGTIADEAFRRLGEQVFDAIFAAPADTAKAAAEGAVQGQAAGLKIAGGMTAGGRMAAETIRNAMVQAGYQAASAMAKASAAGSFGKSADGLVGAAMKIASFGGFFDKGGNLAPGQWGFVGETGMERVRALPNGGVRIEPVKLGAGGAAAQRPSVGASVINFRQTIDLTGANGEETIRGIAYQAAEEGAMRAVQAVEKRQGIRIRMQGE